MLHRLLFPLALCATLFSACKQDEDDEPVVTATPVVTVTGLSATAVARGGSTPVGIAVTSTGGASATTLSVSGLPAGVTASFDPASGTPPFGSVLTIGAGTAAAGATSSATLAATPATGTAKTYSFTVTVTGTCLDAALGSYNVVKTCAPGGTAAHSSVVTADPAFPTRIRISNFDNSSFSVFAEVNCNGSFIDIPTQEPTGASFSVDGAGDISNNSLEIFYNITPLSGGNASSCSAVYTK